jgi:hypothetical protein
MVRINQQGATAGFQNACLCGEGRQSVLAEASGMVGIGRWRGALRISNPVSLIGIAAHWPRLARQFVRDSRETPLQYISRFVTHLLRLKKLESATKSPYRI